MHTPSPSAHACTQPATGTFTHTPRPASTPEPGPNAWQRRYGPAGSAHGMRARHDSQQVYLCNVEVFRDAGQDVAELNLRLGCYTSAQIGVRLTPQDLREVAARLLDAAHDIETNPAAVLSRGAQEGGAA